MRILFATRYVHIRRVWRLQPGHDTVKDRLIIRNIIARWCTWAAVRWQKQLVAIAVSIFGTPRTSSCYTSLCNRLVNWSVLLQNSVGLILIPVTMVPFKVRHGMWKYDFLIKKVKIIMILYLYLLWNGINCKFGNIDYKWQSFCLLPWKQRCDKISPIQSELLIKMGI